MDGVISQEVAAGQIQQMLDFYGFYVEDLADPVRPAIESVLKQIERGVRLGLLEIEVSDDSCEIKQHLKKPISGIPNPIVYRPPAGRSTIAIKDSGNNYENMYAFLGALCGEGPSIFLPMIGKDLSLAQALGVFFLQV